ncbi:major facilitator superfamily domain-containing protein [Gongronella butleri]|nr:major facilitator superfamily domain-containing protein [Gongronella butleri]
MGVKLPFRFNSPLFQVFLVGFICFCCPGIYNALTGMGGVGKADTKTADDSNTALSALFVVFSALGAPIFNILGIRVLIPAGLTYVLFVGSFLTDNVGFNIFAGCMLGIGAGCLWTAQGSIMMSYPEEKNKGLAFAIFWMIFNLGGTVGGAIALGNEWGSGGEANQVNTGTYIGFIVIMAFGAFLAITLLPAKKVLRDDGTPVSLHKYSNWKRETVEILKLIMDWRMIVLIPLMFSSNMFYTYQQQDYNAGLFNIRGRALNNMLYWFMQIVGSFLFGRLMDWERLGNRRTRGYIGGATVLVVMAVLWIGGIVVQQRYTRESVADPSFVKIDPLDPGYGGLLALYFLWGMGDSIYQGYIYWLLGAMSNDSERCARYAGFYKMVQNLGNICAAQVDAHKTAYMSTLIMNFVFNVVGLLLAFIVAYTIPDVTVEEIDNLEGDQKEIVLVGGHLDEKDQHVLADQHVAAKTEAEP